MTAKKATTKSVKKAVKKVVNKTVAKKAIKKPAVTSPKVVKKSTKTSKKTVKKVPSSKKTVKKVAPLPSKANKKTDSLKPVVKRVTKKSATQKNVKATNVAPKKVVKKTAVPKSVVELEHLVQPKTDSPLPPGQDMVAVVSEPSNNETPPQFSSDSKEYWQDHYQEDRLILLIRDPYWCFAYWDLSPENQSFIIRSVQSDHAKLVIRTYDVTDITFDGQNAHRFDDLEISEEASNWYINVKEADRAYCADLGILYPDGTFKTVLRSNVVTTPRDSISPIIDEEWMVVDEMFDQLYQTAGAGDVGRSSEAITKYMLKRVRADVTSGGLASMGSEGGRPKPQKNEDFWLVVHTELIVYGATEPNAKLTIQGQPMTLNNDGTFSVRFALPDGSQRIGVKAVNEADTEERSITPIVDKRTE